MSDFVTAAKARGIVFCLSGPSGVGKGTVIAALRRALPNLSLSISVTTRAPREGEKDGREYYFRSQAEFERLLAAGEILEHDVYCDQYYGTPRAPIEELREQGRDVVLDITVAGSLAVKRNFPDAVTVFLLPPSVEELERRLLRRGTESDAAVRKRLGFALSEIRRAVAFEYLLINQEVESCASALRGILESERLRLKNCPGIEEYIKNL